MLYLWIFGDNVEDHLGHFRYLIFYLVGGVVASLTHLATNWGSELANRWSQRRDRSLCLAHIWCFSREAGS